MRLYECFGVEQTTGDIFKCFFYSFFVIMAIDYDMMIMYGFAIGIDMILGPFKALRLKEVFSIRKFFIGFLTKMVMIIIPFTVAVLGIALNMKAEWTAEVAIRVLLANECLSILANILTIKTKKKVENIDLITLLINWVRENVVKAVEQLLNSKKNENE